MIVASRWLSYRGRFLPIGRAAFRKTLTRGRAQRSPEILLPKWVSVHELRLMLRTNYTSCLRACGVSAKRGSYAWSDQEGRRFQCYNKRHVLVPFELAAVASRTFGFRAIQVSPEPSSPQRCENPKAIPVITIVGHKDHGKTTLMERLTGDTILANEPGETTQTVIIRPVSLPTHGDPCHATLLDTPGDALFEIVRGRAIHLADVAIVVLSAEGGELQTRDVIVQADRFRVPVVFCINKSDLEFNDVEVARAELRHQCMQMHKEGLISSDLGTEIDNAVAISALSGIGLEALGSEIVRRLEGTHLPVNYATLKDGFGSVPLKNVETFLRRTNCLVSSGAPPIAVCFVLEVEKTHSFGIVLTLVVRHGVMIEGSYFVSGTEYGRVLGMYPAHLSITPSNKVERAMVGEAVRMTGVKSMDGISADDLLLVMPQHEAFRLSEYRRDVQRLRAQQVEGPPFNTPWAVMLKTREASGYEIDDEPHELDAVEDSLDDIAYMEDPPLTSIYLQPVDHDSESGCKGEEANVSSDESTKSDEWKGKVEKKNKELHERWKSKLKSSQTSTQAIKPNKMPGLPKITPSTGRPVITLILRANFVGTFDALLDGLEELEKKYHVRISLVHGGLGPIVPGDIVQADIGNKFNFCPVYAFQVPVLNDAVKHAVINKVTVKKFNVYSDLLADVENRCERAVRREAESRENELLRQ